MSKVQTFKQYLIERGQYKPVQKVERQKSTTLKKLKEEIYQQLKKTT